MHLAYVCVHAAAVLSRMGALLPARCPSCRRVFPPASFGLRCHSGGAERGQLVCTLAVAGPVTTLYSCAMYSGVQGGLRFIAVTRGLFGTVSLRGELQHAETWYTPDERLKGALDCAVDETNA